MSSVHSTSLFASVLSVSVCVCPAYVCTDMHKNRYTHTHTHTHSLLHISKHTEANKRIPPNTTTNSLPFALQEMVFNMAVPRVLPGWHNVTVWPSLNVSGPKTTSCPCHSPRQDHPAANSQLCVGELRNLSLSLLCCWQIRG